MLCLFGFLGIGWGGLGWFLGGEPEIDWSFFLSFFAFSLLFCFDFLAFEMVEHSALHIQHGVFLCLFLVGGG